MGIEFWQTPMGRKYYEVQLPALIEQLKKLNTNIVSLKNIEQNLEAIEDNTSEIVSSIGSLKEAIEKKMGS